MRMMLLRGELSRSHFWRGEIVIGLLFPLLRFGARLLGSIGKSLDQVLRNCVQKFVLFNVLDESFAGESDRSRCLEDVDSSLRLQLVVDKSGGAEKTRSSLTVHAMHQNGTRRGALTRVAVSRSPGFPSIHAVQHSSEGMRS